ncbi:hypothetical protein KM043_016392 [Ampulex compressa]|nr:hypothetical protein KM043_016392 [Ampulex compressa]
MLLMYFTTRQKSNPLPALRANLYIHPRLLTPKGDYPRGGDAIDKMWSDYEWGRCPLRDTRRAESDKDLSRRSGCLRQWEVARYSKSSTSRACGVAAERRRWEPSFPSLRSEAEGEAKRSRTVKRQEWRWRGIHAERRKRRKREAARE